MVFRNADDITHLDQLDLKLWMALSMPTVGNQLDPQTAALIDTNGDGRIHPSELIAAVNWYCAALRDPAFLLEGGDRVPLAAIRDEALAAGARHVLTNLGKANADAVALSDVTDRARVFAQTLFNGDGVVPPEAAEGDEPLRRLLEDIVATLGGVPDRGGKQGVDTAQLTQFFAQAADTVVWTDKLDDRAITPLGVEATTQAAAAVRLLREKIEDYFTRCRLAAFDPRALASLNRDPADYRALAEAVLSDSAPGIAAFPLAWVEPARPLPLAQGVNPAWAQAVATLRKDAIEPLLGAGGDSLSESDWDALQAKLAPFEAHRAAKSASSVATLGMERLRALLASDLRGRAEALLLRDQAVAPESERIAAVEKLCRFQRDLREVLTNYVNFADFYGRTEALFQTGTLYIDARACTLCVDVVDDAKHAVMAALSGFFLAYCDLTRPGGLKRKVVAAVTDGASDNLMVGRNGVFYDRRGEVWDATITRIVSAPISVREAFWQPYKKLVRMVEEQIAKRAQAAEEASTAKLSTTAQALVHADAVKTPPPGPPKKIELGTIALIGTAIGGISALVGGFLKALFGLGLWLPAGVAGLILLISGPSVLLASLKLHRRNLAPLLDANGWAINTQARVNIPFGATLTTLAALPPGTVPSLQDPFADKRRPWKWLLLPALLLLLAILWSLGWLDRHLPARFQRHVAIELVGPPAPLDK